MKAIKSVKFVKKRLKIIMLKIKNIVKIEMDNVIKVAFKWF